MSNILKIINTLYEAEDKRHSVWARLPSQTLIDRIPGLLSSEIPLRVRRQSVAVVIDDVVRCGRSMLCYMLLAIASPIPILARSCFIASLIWIFLLMVAVWGWNFTLIAVTDSRVIIRQGWLTRMVKPVRLTQITNATVRQRRNWETLLDIGDVTLEVLAEDDPQFHLLDEPYEFRRLLQYVADAQGDLRKRKQTAEMTQWFDDFMQPGEADGSA